MVQRKRALSLMDDKRFELVVGYMTLDGIPTGVSFRYVLPVAFRSLARASDEARNALKDHAKVCKAGCSYRAYQGVETISYALGCGTCKKHCDQTEQSD